MVSFHILITQILPMIISDHGILSKLGDWHLYMPILFAQMLVEFHQFLHAVLCV